MATLFYYPYCKIKVNYNSSLELPKDYVFINNVSLCKVVLMFSKAYPVNS